MKRVCLLTGASGKLGRAFIRAHAGDYDIVAVHHRTPAASICPTTVDPLNVTDSHANRNHIFPVQADLGEPGQVERVVELALARFDQIDLLINAAVFSRWGKLVECAEIVEEAEEQFLINCVVPMRLSVAVAHASWRNHEKENRRRRRNIVNLSSTAGAKIYRGAGQSVYAASKAALNMMSAQMAGEFEAFGVRVNCISPNSFPSAIPTRTVVDAIIRLDHGSDSGLNLILDARPEPTENGSDLIDSRRAPG